MNTPFNFRGILNLDVQTGSDQIFLTGSGFDQIFKPGSESDLLQNRFSADPSLDMILQNIYKH